MSGAVVALIIIVIIIVYLITMTTIAVFTESKVCEKLGLIGWLGHAVHQMVNGVKWNDIRLHHYEQIKQRRDAPTTISSQSSQPLTTGGRGPIYDPEF